MRRARACLVVFGAALLWAGAALGQTGDPRSAALDYIGRGKAAFRVGDLVAATAQWTQAIRLCRAAGDTALEAEALTRRGEAYSAAGHFREAVEDLAAAARKAEQSGDQGLVAASSGALGNLLFLSRRTAAAEPLLLKSHNLAQRLGDSRTRAASANDLGNLYAATDRPTEAASAYQEAVAAAGEAGDAALAATAAVNAARLALRRNEGGRAAALLDAGIAQLRRLPPSAETAGALVTAGSVVFEAAGVPEPQLEALARQALEAAAAEAEGLRDMTSRSLALGSLARLDAREGRVAEAARLNAQALFAAQQTGAAELSARWEWQQARLLRRQGHAEDALASYRRAVADLQSVRPAIAVEYRGGRSSYRQTYGSLYLETADLLLRQAAADPGGAAPLLREARDSVEALKETELQDYFRDECVTSFEAKRRAIDTLAPGTAVLYPIVLPDRLELLADFGGELRQFTVPIGRERLDGEVRAFRRLLEKRFTNEYLPLARDLYDRIIRPVEPALAAHHVDTLVVVPDDVLRLIPFAALHDGRQFLIERYATAVAPSLKLVDPKPLAGEARNALAVGIADSVQGYSGLPAVPGELAAVRQLEHGKVLLDAQFSRPAFRKELEGTAYNIVHIASHGEFGSDPSRTFVLAFDGRLTMDDLEQEIKFGQYRQNPIELLTLSACQTAAGDDRAALGLAGVALKAGARSTVAALWFVSDKASSQMVTDFYRALQDPHVSRARALQLAQQQFLADPVLGHPSYWAPFLLIGDWL